MLPATRLWQELRQKGRGEAPGSKATGKFNPMSTFARPSGYRSTTATARVTDNLSLYGHHGQYDEPEHRPFPTDDVLDGIVSSLFDGIASPLNDTALQPDIADLLWSLANLFHHKAGYVQRLLDSNEMKQKAAHEQDDRSEISSVALERLIEKGQLLVEKRAAFQRMRDQAAEQYAEHTGSVWLPRSGSKVSHKPMTAAVVDSRDYINAKRRAETEIMLPAGPKVAFAGGPNYNDHVAIWKVLDAARAKHPDMVLIHGGTDRGAEAIATAWAVNRKVPCVPFKPEWNRDGKQAAPFKRNERMLETMPIGLIVFPGNGYTENLADSARRLGIPVTRPIRP